MRTEFPIPWKHEGLVIGAIQLALLALFITLATYCG